MELLGELGEAQQAVLQLQQALQTAHERTGELKATIKGLMDWSGEKKRYVLKELGPDALVYVNKASKQGEEPPHALCVHCYEDAKRSILQFAGNENGFRVLACPRCGNRVLLGTVTIKFDPDDLRSLMAERVESSDLPAEERNRLAHVMRSLPEQALRDLITRLVNESVTRWPEALQLFQTCVAQ